MSLENTGKHQFKDLSATFQLEELSGQLKPKFDDIANVRGKNMQSERTPDIGKTTKLIPSTDKITADNITDKSKSFYSDEIKNVTFT